MALDLEQRIRTILSIDPDANAVEFEGNWHSWKELGDIASGLEDLLRTAGCGAGTPVGLILRNSPEMIGAMLGTILCDGCIVTLNPHQGDAKLCQDIRDLRVPIVVAHAEDWARPGLRDVAQDIGAMGVEIASGARGSLALVDGLTRVGSGPHRRPAPGIAVEMLTSGTTGAPKRILLDYAAFEKTISAAGKHYKKSPQAAVDAGPRLAKGVAIVSAPFVHMSGLFRTLLNICEGRQIALLERFQIATWRDLVRRHRPKAVSLVPAALRMVLDSDVTREDLEGVVVVTSGSAKLDPEVQAAFEDKFDIAVLPSYGATEFSGGVAGWTLPLHREWNERKRGSVGTPQPGRQIRVVEQHSGDPLPNDTVGLLEIKAGETWVRTTDFARIDDDGFLWITGRADDAIIRGGFKIFPADVASVLQAHPAVREASVVGIADERLGMIPVAAVELREGGTLSSSELLDFARGHLSTYQLPREVRIVETLPRTPSMKVSQPEVRSLFDFAKADS